MFFYFVSTLSVLGLWYLVYKKPFLVLLGLILVVPFHAFLTTYLSHLWSLDQSQMLLLVLWKEIIILSLMVRVAYIGIRDKKSPITWMWFDYLILCMFGLALVVNYVNSVPAIITAHGLRYDFLLFAVYWTFRSFDFKDEQILKIIKAILWSGVVIAVFTIIQTFLPADFLVRFGYANITEWNPLKYDSLPAHFLIYETNTQRYQSFMSGPNNLGAYLAIIWAGLSAVLVISKSRSKIWLYVLGLVVVGIATYLTYSRSAWLVLLVISFGYLLTLFKKAKVKGLIVVIALAISWIGLYNFSALPSNVSRISSSSEGHLIRGAAAVYTIGMHPEGLGVGTAGPTSLRFVESPSQIDKASHPLIHSYLEKVGINTNIDAYAKTLKGPIIPENWFLQIGVELGVLGMLVFIAIITGVMYGLYFIYRRQTNPLHKELALMTLLLGLGLTFHSLFLHTWSDAPVTIVFWALVGMMFASNKSVFTQSSENKSIE